MPKKTKNIITGYKVFNPDFTCRGFKYEVGKEFIHEGNVELCNSGFHFCRKAVDCFGYYNFDPNNIVCEVEARGISKEKEDKTATDILFIKRQLTWNEVLEIVNTGKGNTGHSNSGDSNSGDSNSGNSNSGDSNSGYRNSGDRNSGNSNSGDSNSGNRNSGDRNSGNSNSGDSNSGYSNSGYSNSGYSNSGNRNSGNSNSGNRNSGDRNSGNSNSGNSNSGYSNSGDSNSGNSNSGDFNNTNRSSGVFNNQEAKILMFNKPSYWTYSNWYNSDAYDILANLTLNKWIDFSDMTDQEKIDHPKAYVCDGYLKTFEYKEACQNLWNNLTATDKKKVIALPNFDAVVFEDITGIKIK